MDFRFLPNELHRHILSFLPVKDLARITPLCRLHLESFRERAITVLEHLIKEGQDLLGTHYLGLIYHLLKHACKGKLDLPPFPMPQNFLPFEEWTINEFPSTRWEFGLMDKPPGLILRLVAPPEAQLEGLHTTIRICRRYREQSSIIIACVSFRSNVVQVSNSNKAPEIIRMHVAALMSVCALLPSIFCPPAGQAQTSASFGRCSRTPWALYQAGWRGSDDFAKACPGLGGMTQLLVRAQCPVHFLFTSDELVYV